jgi:hypothetical protein
LIIGSSGGGEKNEAEVKSLSGAIYRSRLFGTTVSILRHRTTINLIAAFGMAPHAYLIQLRLSRGHSGASLVAVSARHGEI